MIIESKINKLTIYALIRNLLKPIDLMMKRRKCKKKNNFFKQFIKTFHFRPTTKSVTYPTWFKCSSEVHFNILGSMTPRKLITGLRIPSAKKKRWLRLNANSRQSMIYKNVGAVKYMSGETYVFKWFAEKTQTLTRTNSKLFLQYLEI